MQLTDERGSDKIVRQHVVCWSLEDSNEIRYMQV